MPAVLIWDSLQPKRLTVPPEAGTPAPHQLQGSPLDNLAELAGRECYDSLGAAKSRSSAEYHQHIHDVQHLSVYRHCAFTVELRCLPAVFLNRPGIWVERAGSHKGSADPLRVTLNLQSVLEWDRVRPIDALCGMQAAGVGYLLKLAAKSLAPLSIREIPEDSRPLDLAARIVYPENDNERGLSYRIWGVSRGLTHELVRHGAYTAPSQRSTRYCDEADSPWTWHPLIRDGWTDEAGDRRRLTADARAALDHAQAMCQDAYENVVNEMVTGGVDRKQARGAARGVLGNALSTSLIFSASLARWKEIAAVRNHPAADGEIRELFAEIEGKLPGW